MKEKGKRKLKIALMMIFTILIMMVGLTVYHQIRLKIEQGKLIPPGTIVQVDGDNMHVYVEGEDHNNPTLVFMSGYSTVAPVYNFKTLYSLFSTRYPIAVVEKKGYGYSETTTIQRGLDTVLEETREALRLAGCKTPFVLFPHSLTGQEAIYWAHKYPDEILGIVGLDMDFLTCYDSPDADSFDDIARLTKNVRLFSNLGVFRLLPFFATPDVASTKNAEFSDGELEQLKYLKLRNMFNSTLVAEAKAVSKNIELLKSIEFPDIPILNFSSNGSDIGDYWVGTVMEFERTTGAQVVYLDCGHYVHNHMPETIYAESLLFLQKIKR